MARPTPGRRLRPHARSFLNSLRLWLTPAIWKQAHRARRPRRRAARWATQPLLLTLLVMTWCCGDSQAERFETAKAFTAVCRSKRRQPGRTPRGFQKALARLPLAALRAVAAGLRRRLAARLELASDGFVVLGCDGSALDCPRVAELESRLDPPLKRRGVPQLWVTALVHLRSGLLWAWRLGKGRNRERSHLRALLATAPAAALIVADAGYNGYDLARAILASGASFLIRMSGKDTLYTAARPNLRQCRDGEVLCWPKSARDRGLPPLPLRLLRLRSRRRRDVWLLTDVRDAGRLSLAQAGRYYRWRWENEGLFRTYKRTLAKVKLQSRTVRLVHREAEGALLATQVLLAQGAQAQPAAGPAGEAQRCSPRKVLLAIREVILGRLGPRQRQDFAQRLAQACREQRRRVTPKVKRKWSRRVDYKPPKPPKLRELTEQLRALLAKQLQQPA